VVKSLSGSLSVLSSFVVDEREDEPDYE
jgi:hypothetical protein